MRAFLVTDTSVKLSETFVKKENLDFLHVGKFTSRPHSFAGNESVLPEKECDTVTHTGHNRFITFNQ